ncbi:unnamed protein product [Cylicocyclus nassatus]|uniref:EF-hand domain-containing protein n=1 Tax=Cylicocyclus nassatus TaxID=53992 RepID=A0AA36MFD3_CYLNA|nr:unnamed protein product [Cylicocyclus nassatus]
MVKSSIGELEAKYPDVDPFLLRKWERIFSMFFDRNASHQIDRGDFYLVIRKVKDIYGAESEQTDFARKTLTTLWENLCKTADSDNDQSVSIDEWIKFLKSSTKSEEMQWFTDYRTFMFQLFDVSCDNLLDIEEYIDGMNVYGVKRPEAKEAFQKFAVDASGKNVPVVSKEMWARHFYDLFYSTDKNALGNHLFGVSDFQEN